jgi:hypothetical protein
LGELRLRELRELRRQLSQETKPQAERAPRRGLLRGLLKGGQRLVLWYLIERGLWTGMVAFTIWKTVPPLADQFAITMRRIADALTVWP